jgi:hypothetical protein
MNASQSINKIQRTLEEERKTSYIGHILSTLKERMISQNFKVEIISLTIGAILVLIGILACMWEPYNQEQIIKSISLAFF